MIAGFCELSDDEIRAMLWDAMWGLSVPLTVFVVVFFIAWLVAYFGQLRSKDSMSFLLIVAACSFPFFLLAVMGAIPWLLSVVFR
jgi:hypothetical protein